MQRALDVCEARGFVQEQVYLLSRMGNAAKALQLLICGLRDLPAAIALASREGDAQLWDVLVDLTLSSSELTGACGCGCVIWGVFLLGGGGGGGGCFGGRTKV